MTQSRTIFRILGSPGFLIMTAFSMVSSGLFAQINNPIYIKRCPVNTINNDQGLLNNSIRGIITDARGFTWISTPSGLQRYNGYVLQKVTPVVDGDTIPITYPVYFLPGKRNTVWIGYKNGILEYFPENNFFKKLISIQAAWGIDRAIMPLQETPEGIWCFEENTGVVMYKRSGNSFLHTSSTENAQVTTLSGKEEYVITRKLVAVNHDFIFIRQSPNKILQINTGNHQSKILDYPGPAIIGLECNDNKIFVASGDGLAYINIPTGFISKKFLYKKINDYPVTRSTIEKSSNNRLLVTVEKRLYEFDTSCVCLKEIISLNREPLLNTGYIQVVYEDKFLRIWLLTHQDIKRIQDVETPFAHLIYASEKDNFVRAIYYDKERKTLLGGGYAGLIQLYDSAGNALWDRSIRRKDIYGILSIEKLSEDHYLILTQGNGLHQFSLRTKQLAALDLGVAPTFRQSIKDNSYSNNMERTDDSTILISTKSNLFKCHFRNDRLQSAEALLNDSAVAGHTLSCFHSAFNGNLWVGTQEGSVLLFHPKGDFRMIRIPETDLVRSMAEDGHHDIWIGTDRGLFVLNESGKLVHRFTRESGLLSDIIYAILPADRTNNLFASTNFGISSITPDGKINNFTRDLGLQENEFNTQSCARSPGGRLFFGGINGITAFYPSALSMINDYSLINITRLIVNDSLFNSFGGPWKGDSLILAYNQNRIQFDIAATGLLNPNEYLYKYRLHGFEESWQTTNRPIGIRYTLEPGSYSLEISCSPILLSNSELHQRILIIINPPWWKAWWFVLGTIGAASLLIFTISYYFTWQRYQLKIKKMEIQQQLIYERERISRELHDNIGSQLSYISSNIDWLVEAPGSFSKEEETKRLVIVNDTAKNLVADLRETIWAMKKESIMMDELADKMKSFLQSQCLLQPQMEMIVTENIENRYQFSPTEALNIFRICQEAMVNVMKHAHAEKIFLNIQSGTREVFSFTIEDNGRGFTRKEHYNGHFGLENMTHRAAESGVELVIHSDPGKGTTVKVVKHPAVKNQAGD
jgi:ligand-binding sensor domain-containing protein/two-component sensor histidine kinase